MGLWLWQFKIMNHTQTVADRERVLHAEPSQPQLGSRRVEASPVTWPGHMADYADSCRVFGYLLCLHCLHCLHCSALVWHLASTVMESEPVLQPEQVQLQVPVGRSLLSTLYSLLSSTFCAALFWSGGSHLIACQQIVIVGISSPGQSQACATPPTVGATSLHIVIEKFNQIIS